MASELFRTLRSATVVAVLAGVLGCGLPQTAFGQDGNLWLQTARVVTPIENGPTRAFLDTLVSVMGRRGGLGVWRSPKKEKRMSVSTLRNQLISEEGIGLTSANHAFIGYRFSIDNGSRFRQTISAIHFVYRPGPRQTDISVMYLDARQPWVQEVIMQKGTSLRSNQAALIPFHRHLGFAHVARQKKTEVVEIGGETVRKEFDERKEDLIQRVERLMYQTYV